MNRRTQRWDSLLLRYNRGCDHAMSVAEAGHVGMRDSHGLPFFAVDQVGVGEGTLNEAA